TQKLENLQEPFCSIDGDVLVKDRPPDLKHRDQIVLDEKVIMQRLGKTPHRRPVLQPEVADRNGRVQGLLCCKWPALEGTPPPEGVRKIGELLVSSAISNMVAIEDELHMQPDAPERVLVAAALVLRSSDQRARRRRNDACLEKYICQRRGRFGTLGKHLEFVV